MGGIEDAKRKRRRRIKYDGKGTDIQPMNSRIKNSVAAIQDIRAARNALVQVQRRHKLLQTKAFYSLLIFNLDILPKERPLHRNCTVAWFPARKPHCILEMT